MLKRLLLSLILCASAFATERHMWLLTQTNIPGVSETATPETLYGVLVLLDSDDATVTAFDVTVRVLTETGDTLVFQTRVPKAAGKGEGVVFSTAWASYFSKGLAWSVTGVQVGEVR